MKMIMMIAAVMDIEGLPPPACELWNGGEKEKLLLIISAKKATATILKKRRGSRGPSRSRRVCCQAGVMASVAESGVMLHLFVEEPRLIYGKEL
jgi:hypothetical protein